VAGKRGQRVVVAAAIAFAVGALSLPAAASPSTTTSTSSTTTSTTTTLSPGTLSPGTPSTTAPGTASLSGGGTDPVSIRTAQNAIITEDHLVSIDLAQLAVNRAQSSTNKDQSTLAGDQQAAAKAAADQTAAAATLGTDQSALGRAAAADTLAQLRLARDRARLRSLAVALYAAGPSGLAPTSLQGLLQDQQAVFEQSEVDLVGTVVITNLHTDTTAADTADRFHRGLIKVVAVDTDNLAVSEKSAAHTSAMVARDQQKLAADEKQLAATQDQLGKANASLTADLARIPGPLPAASGGITLLGTAALDANQMAGWYNAQGYTDLTTAPISQLATWYLKAGTQLGIRGDLAFAQAVLETAGFSSADAVTLNNYAGIGHCDTCSAGLGFPSPQDGVIGQLQLLRIFAGAGAPPKGAPGPVLPTLIPAHVARSGCCQTWEALTGVWATDPLYATKILTIYVQMLQFAQGTAQPVSVQSQN
jgi:Mannosyl-glycoprotein endo-beta-N-acetylglucosaminidase